MGWGYQARYIAPPCPNCGKPDAGRMSSTEWGHNHACCSHACGKRLLPRILNGFKPGLSLSNDPWRSHQEPGGEGYSFPRAPSPLRIEIKKLRHRLKAMERRSLCHSAQEGNDHE